MILFHKDNGIYKPNSYKIEIAYVVKEIGDENLSGYKEKTYIGKYSYSNFIISNDIYCLDDSCTICNESLICLICNENMNINEFKNKCGFSFTENIATKIDTNYNSIIQTERNTLKTENDISI